MERLPWVLPSLGEGLGPLAQRLGTALFITLAAWLVAWLVRKAVQRLGARAGLDARAHHPGLSVLLASIAGGLVWLFALPAILGALEMKALLDPVNVMMSRLLGFLPNLLGAAVILGIGVLLGGVLRRIVAGMLSAAGSERLAQRMGLGNAMGGTTLASLGGSVVFALVLLPTVAAALDALGMDAVTRPVSNLLDGVMSLLPRLVSGGMIMLLAVVLGRVLANLVSGILAGLGVNAWAPHLGLGDDFQLGGRKLSELAGLAVMVGVVCLALAQATAVVGLSAVTEAVVNLGAGLARLLVALVIFGVGLWAAQVLAMAVKARSRPHAAVLARVARAAVLFFAGALALRQAGLPAEIVALMFGSVVVGLALGVAVAVGLGGQQLAQRLLDNAAAALSKNSDDATAQKD